MNNENRDFYGGSHLASFDPANPSDTTSVTVTVTNDPDPEIMETHYFTLKILNSSTADASDARVTVPNVATVRILANDDAYGLFSFIGVSCCCFFVCLFFK